jgi:hypothetical protein
MAILKLRKFRVIVETECRLLTRKLLGSSRGGKHSFLSVNRVYSV